MEKIVAYYSRDSHQGSSDENLEIFEGTKKIANFHGHSERTDYDPHYGVTVGGDYENIPAQRVIPLVDAYEWKDGIDCRWAIAGKETTEKEFLFFCYS